MRSPIDSEVTQIENLFCISLGLSSLSEITVDGLFLGLSFSGRGVTMSLGKIELFVFVTESGDGGVVIVFIGTDLRDLE